MMHRFGKVVVLALGGSVVFPESIDTLFLARFKKFLAPFLRRKMKFVLVVGGGWLSRLFQEAAAKLNRVSDEDKDWIGIHATRLNAQLLRTIFEGVADPVVLDARGKIKKLRYPVTIASGWRPGWSTDYVTVALAKDFGVREVVIAGKPSHVYDKDHAKHKNAKPIGKLSWKEYRALVPARWTPGMHAPMDPVGARLAERAGISAIIIQGKDLENFKNLLNGKEFRGSVIG
ncbi:MAG: UMP kinase [Candidatus Liptonbacteria bacterium]|nr:UMP kinase [Candidatus Liptonbacteria bacterium]